MNIYNDKKELILWDHGNPIIYTSEKLNPIPSEYFIWSHNSLIARTRYSNNLYIDGTYHHPKDFAVLIVILFKDIITKERFPCFFILLSNTKEQLYLIVLKSIRNIISQNNIYKLNLSTITTDQEISLVNAVDAVFPKIRRISCWFHLKEDLIRNARAYGLMNKKNKNINIDLTYEIIKEVSLIPFLYNGNLKFVYNKIDELVNKNPYYKNFLYNYFLQNKIQYFKDNSYNYNLCPIDCRSNSILERYNKTIKQYLGEKVICNWVKFLNFIITEIDVIKNKLGENNNSNILYMEKLTKFKREKYINNNEENFQNINEEDNVNILNSALNNINLNEENNNNNLTIKEVWLTNNNNLYCRYNSFITIFYFFISSYISDKLDKKFTFLHQLNKLILDLVDDVSDAKLKKIIEFFQKNEFDSNNALLDNIKNYHDEIQKIDLINNYKNRNIDYNSTGYVVELFKLFKDIKNFCIVEKKYTKCILCNKETNEIIKPFYQFLQVTEENLKLGSILNILLKKSRNSENIYCECKKKEDNLLSTIVQYQIDTFPDILFILFDLSYDKLSLYKESIFKIVKDEIILTYNINYKLKGVINIPFNGHFSCVIFNPCGSNIKDVFQPNQIYKHDGMLNLGKVVEMKESEDWKDLGIIYIAIYKKI